MDVIVADIKWVLSTGYLSSEAAASKLRKGVSHRVGGHSAVLAIKRENLSEDIVELVKGMAYAIRWKACWT